MATGAAGRGVMPQARSDASAWRARLRAESRCMDCKQVRPLVPGVCVPRCVACYARYVAYRRERYAARKRLELCPRLRARAGLVG